MSASGSAAAGPSAAVSSAVGAEGAGAMAASREPGNGSSSARPKITTMTPMTTRFATEMVKIDQVR